MSTLVAQTLSNGTVSTSTANCITGSAKAWVNFNGTGTVAIRGSFNVSSITDNGTGDYTVNFTTAMPNANYCTNATGTHASGSYVAWGAISNANPPTTSNVTVNTLNTSTSVDVTFVQVSVFSP